MADTYVINTVFKAHDQMSSTIGSVTNKMGRFGKQSARSFKKATTGALKFQTVLGGVLGANLVSAGINRIRQSVGGLTSEFLDFDQAITSASAKFGFDKGTEQFKELAKGAREVASITPFSAAQTGKALDFLAMAGFNASQSMASLKGVTDLAVAGEMDLAEAADISTDALGALGLMSKDPEVLAKNLDRVNDVMAEVAVSANTNIPMLWAALKQVAPVATGLGGTIEELGAMFGILAASGVKEEKAGTALRNMYIRLTGGTSEVEKVLKKYNIAIENSDGKMRTMSDLLAEIGEKTKGLSDKTRQAALTHLFGTRAVNSASIMIRAGRKPLSDYQKRLEGVDGAVKKLARRVGESLPNKLKIMRSRLIEIGFSIIETFEDKIPGAMASFQESLDSIDPAEIVSSITKVWDTVASFKLEIEAFIAAIVIYNVTMKGAAAVQWALNVAMAANPIGLMIAGFVALSTTIFMVYRNWDIVKQKWQKDMEDIGQWIDEKIIMQFEKVIKFFPKISKFFGLTARSDTEINKMYAGQAEAGQPGYILGGEAGKRFGNLPSEALRAEKDRDEIERKLAGIYNQPAREIQKRETDREDIEKGMADIFKEYSKGLKIKQESAAKPQKVQFSGEFNFNNPPSGMEFKQKTRGAPPIEHNLGAN